VGGLESLGLIRVIANCQDTVVGDRISTNCPSSRIHCEALYQEFRIDILRLPTGLSEETFFEFDL